MPVFYIYLCVSFAGKGRTTQYEREPEMIKSQYSTVQYSTVQYSTVQVWSNKRDGEIFLMKMFNPNSPNRLCTKNEWEMFIVIKVSLNHKNFS